MRRSGLLTHPEFLFRVLSRIFTKRERFFLEAVGGMSPWENVVLRFFEVALNAACAHTVC